MLKYIRAPFLNYKNLLNVTCVTLGPFAVVVAIQFSRISHSHALKACAVQVPRRAAYINQNKMFRQHFIYLFLLSAKLINSMDFENPLTRSTRAKDRGKLLDQQFAVNH